MKCLKCGEENNNDAGRCFKCNTPLLWTPESDTKEFGKIKISKLAIIAISLSIISLVLYLICPILEENFILSNSDLHNLAFVSLGISILGIILGIFSLLLIEVSGGKIKGLGFSIGAILIPIFAMVILFTSAITKGRKQVAFQTACRVNLQSLGRAMLAYANDYNTELPRAGDTTTVWGTSVIYDAMTRNTEYGMASDGTGGEATISSSLYLLVKYSYVSPKFFICNGDYGKGVNQYRPTANQNLRNLWDFGSEPWKHVSYAYHMPYGTTALTTSSNPGMAVAADRNPWIPSGWGAKNFAKFNTGNNATLFENGNSPSHNSEGQNVLFVDGRVSFSRYSICGISNDNIYTSWNGRDITKGTVPTVGSQPAGLRDSLLVNDPPATNR